MGVVTVSSDKVLAVGWRRAWGWWFVSGWCLRAGTTGAVCLGKGAGSGRLVSGSEQVSEFSNERWDFPASVGVRDQTCNIPASMGNKRVPSQVEPEVSGTPKPLWVDVVSVVA